MILIVHVRKPAGRGTGGRQLSDVLGEWGRWCDVVVLQENDGKSLDRAKLTTRKRVRHQRRIVATKAGGLLRDAVDLEGVANAKVPEADVLHAVETHRGATFAELGEVIGVSKDTAKRYVAKLGERVQVVPMGARRELRVYLVDEVDSDRSTATHQTDAALLSTESEPPHRDAPTIASSTPSRTAARSTAQQTPVAAVVPEGADRSIRPPHLKVGEVRRSDAASSPHRASTHAAVASQGDIPAGIGRRADGSIWCQFFRDHQTHHENVSRDPRCRICSPEDPA